MNTFWKRGEPFVWISGATLAATLIITVVLVVVVISNGLGVFWPHDIEQITTKDGKRWAGEVVSREEVPDKSGTRVKMKVGNRDLYGFDFKWFDDNDLVKTEKPEDIIVLERMEYGNFYGYLKGIQIEGKTTTAEPEKAYKDALVRLQPYLEKEEEIQDRINTLNQKISGIQRQRQKLDYKKVSETTPDYKGLTDQQGLLKVKFKELLAEQDENNRHVDAYHALFEDAHGQKKAVLLADIVRKFQPNRMGLGAKTLHYCGKIWELLSAQPRESNTEGGLWPALFGTAILVFMMSIFSFPFGVIAGIYLREYAKDGILVRAVRIAVNNLAGIPSIVYGVFGLGFFIYGIGGAMDQLFFPERLPTPTFGTGGILWASLTLGLLTVPVVIVSTEEAFGAIPRGVREASMALGATRFQTLLKVLLPMASPGIMTGFILAMARAAGEVAPLMITGVVKLAPALPIDGYAPFVHMERKFMHLGFHIYDIGFQSPNVEAAKPMVFVTTFLLVVLVLIMTSAAIMLRNRMKKKYTLGTF